MLDYQLVQYRVLPYLASAFAFLFARKRIVSEIGELGPEDDIGAYHRMVSGLKAAATRTCLAGVEECRQCCGGHGFLKSAGLSDLVGTGHASVTFEGENQVMLLQTGQFLLKNLNLILLGKGCHPLACYLRKIKHVLKIKA